MEQLIAWPNSVFPKDPSTITEDQTGLNKTQTLGFIKAEEKWRDEATRIKTEIECKTEDVSFNTESAREFIKAHTFTEAKKADLRAACDNHSKRMLGFMKEVNSLKLNDFLKSFALDDNAKTAVKMSSKSSMITL